jgi:acetoin utilization deacetylase AcuC-like enzyme
MEGAILPILDRFLPEIILVSYGFDTHWRDPLGNLLLSAGGYASLIRALVNWADIHCHGKILLILEGGYDLESAAACGVGVTAALLGEEFEDTLGPSPVQEREDWTSMLSEAKEIWSI